MYRQDVPDTEEVVLALAKRNLGLIAQVTAIEEGLLREVALGVGKDSRAEAFGRP